MVENSSGPGERNNSSSVILGDLDIPKNPHRDWLVVACKVRKPRGDNKGKAKVKDSVLNGPKLGNEFEKLINEIVNEDDDTTCKDAMNERKGVGLARKLEKGSSLGSKNQKISVLRRTQRMEHIVPKTPVVGHEIKRGIRKHSQKKLKNTHRIIHFDATLMKYFLSNDLCERDSSLQDIEVWD